MLHVLSRFRSYICPTSHWRRGTPSIEEPMWLGGDSIIHSSVTSSSMIHFMSTLISYQKAYFIKGMSFPRNHATLWFSGTGCISSITFITVGSYNQAFFLIIMSFFLKGLRFITQRLSVNYWSYRESTKCWRWWRLPTFGGRGANKFSWTA